MQSLFRHAPWITAAATTLLSLTALLSGDDEWLTATLIFSLVNVLLVLPLSFPERFAAFKQSVTVKALADGQAAEAPRFVLPLTWMTGAACVISWILHLGVEEEETLISGIVFTVGLILLALFQAFPGRFNLLHRVIVGFVVLLIVMVIGLLVFAAGMAGFSGIK